MKKLSQFVCASLLTLVAANASAQVVAPVTVVSQQVVVPRDTFGQKGQLLIGGSSAFGVAGLHNDGDHSVGVSLTPSVSTFVHRNLALGGRLGGAYARVAGHNRWALDVGPQITGNIHINERLSLLPSFAPLYKFAAIQGERTENLPLGSTNHSHAVALAVGIDAAVHVAEHVSITVGPHVEQEVFTSAGSKYPTQYGLKVGVLGWL